MRELNKKIWPFKTRLHGKTNSDLFENRYGKTNSDLFENRYDWLKDNLKESDWYIVNGDTYYFVNEQDLMLFLLRWK